MASWRPQPPPEVSRCKQVQVPPRSHLLQVVSEALDISPSQQQDEPIQSTPEAAALEAVVPYHHSKTVVTASDGQVSNGFVLHGQNLPYVFEEATDPSGARKKSSKILPVCAVCGKRFVCVTTMKRHLVTHTGEKPFSCKICGKHYTQKGNLRVHERTHRNDRPFECQICHQKFYRKEPMQKHQWRQHGIVHLKSSSRSSNSGSEEAAPTPPPAPAPTPAPNPTPINPVPKHDRLQQSPYDNLFPNTNTNAKSLPSSSPIIHNEQTNAETSPIKLKMKLAYQQHLIDQCKEKSSTKWITDKPLDFPLDLSSKSSLSDNQPSLLPAITNLPTTKEFNSNVPTIQMSDGTLSKLLQNFTTKSSITNNPAAAMPNRCSKLLHGLFQSEGVISRTV